MSYPPEFLEFLKRITNKRPKTVINHILKHGYVTTQELKDLYGYNHPPRAARDVREQGVPLVTFWVEGADGRKIAAYKFGDPDQIQRDKLGGRKMIPKAFKEALIDHDGKVCAICGEAYESTLLQVDHRIPYEISGPETADERAIDDYMLLCGSCNRAKSWSCEHCENWTTLLSVETCLTCYWANPGTYTHIAMQAVRRIDLVWMGEEVSDFDHLRQQADQADKTIQDHIKAILSKYLRGG